MAERVTCPRSCGGQRGHGRVDGLAGAAVQQHALERRQLQRQQLCHRRDKAVATAQSAACAAIQEERSQLNANDSFDERSQKLTLKCRRIGYSVIIHM